MSRFFSGKYESLEAYIPGEQPQDMKYIKLNTNESPFPTSQKVANMTEKECVSLRLYSDPECTALREKLAQLYKVEDENVLVTNGSDEILNFAFMAFGDTSHPFVFPDVTYGFYTVFADVNGVPYEEIPLMDNFKININDYIGLNKNIVIANPNAPTGIALKREQIEKIIKSNPDAVVVVDEAYVDFGAESCIPLINKYDNLLVAQTFSKSRSMAGARLGYGIACKELIRDLNTIKYSTNPYNVNRLTMAAGIAALEENDYYMENCKKIEDIRQFTANELEKRGFEVLPSRTNFIFAKSDKISGEKLYLSLKERGVLIRHFTKEKIKDYNRITIGTRQEMEIFLNTVDEIIKQEE
ncbi:MAG: histidinol-phosphate transaminase [Bacillota bacterium]|nr:histidinol-phosphate transaminase [Bacillota bacterium]